MNKNTKCNQVSGIYIIISFYTCVCVAFQKENSNHVVDVDALYVLIMK